MNGAPVWALGLRLDKDDSDRTLDSLIVALEYESFGQRRYLDLAVKTIQVGEPLLHRNRDQDAPISVVVSPIRCGLDHVLYRDER